jgi:tripartite-type tricarboxylate transporter receptor subunit TctC
MLALQKSAVIDMVQVPYRDFAPAIQDLTQGRLQVAATAVSSLVPHHRANTAKLLFVTNRERSPQALDVPTASEAGYPDLTFEGTVGIYGWRDMPAEIRERVSKDVQAITRDPAFRTRLVAGGTAARTGTAAEFAAAIEEQRAKIAALHLGTAKPAQ